MRYSPPLLAGFRCRCWWAVPATPGWGPLAALVCGVWCVAVVCWWGWGVCVVWLVPRHSWRRFLCATPRHSWLGFAAGVGGRSPPLLAGVRWRRWCVVCGVWRWCVAGVGACVWCGWSLATPGGGSSVLLPATPGWVSLPVVAGGPRHSWLGSAGGVGVWCVVCGGGVLVGLWLVCGVVGPSPLLAEVPVCYSPPLLAGFRCRCWWAVPATPGWGPLGAFMCGVWCVAVGCWWGCGWCVVWWVPHHSWRRCLCATPRHSWLGFAAGVGGRSPPLLAGVCWRRWCVVCVSLAGSGGPASRARFGAPHLFLRPLCLSALLGPLRAGVAPLSLAAVAVVLVAFFFFFFRPPAAWLSVRSRLVCVFRLAVGCSLVVAPPAPSPFVSRGLRRSCLVPWSFFFFFFPSSSSSLRPRCLWLSLVSGPGCPGPRRLRFLLCWPAASRLSVRLSLFRAFRLGVGCSLVVASPPPPLLCVSRFSSLPLGAVCCVVLCVPGCGAAPRCCAFCRPVLCCRVLCCARLVPLLVALCSAALCFAVFPRAVCVLSWRGGACCVCLGVLCCAFPVLSALCGAVLRCAGVLALCCLCGACCCWRLVLWCAAVCCAVSCGVPWCGAGSGGPWLSAGGVFRCRCPCLAAWSASLWLVWFAVVPCFPVSCSVVLCCRVVLCCCALLSCCGAVGACFVLLWAVVLCCVVLLVGCAVFCPVVVSACCGALFLVLCVPCLLRSVRCGALLCWLWCPASLCRVLWRCAVVWCCAVVLCCPFAVLFVFALPSCGLSCGASVVCAVVGACASCCGVSLCVVVSPWAFCGVVVLLWCVVVSCCAVRCPVVSCALCRVLRCRAALRCCAGWLCCAVVCAAGVCFSFWPLFFKSSFFKSPHTY